MSMMMGGMGSLGGFGDIFSGIAQGASSYMAAGDEAYNDQERAMVDRFNAQVAENTAKQEMSVSAADAVDFRHTQSARIAASNAAQGASGFLLKGSPLLVKESQLTEQEFGVDRIMGDAMARAQQDRIKATLLRREAGVEDTNAGFANQAGVMGLFSGITQGFGSYASGMARYGTLATSGGGFF